MFRILSLTTALVLSCCPGLMASPIQRCLEIASETATQQGLSVYRPDIAGALVLTGSHEGQEYQLTLRFADSAGQPVLSSSAHSKASIFEVRTNAERHFYSAFWGAAQKEGIQLLPLEDYASNLALLAPLLGSESPGDILALETADGNVVVADLSQGAPHPTTSDWGTFQAAGCGLEPFENTFRLYWLVALASPLTGEVTIEVDEVSGPKARRLIESRGQNQQGSISVRSSGYPVDTMRQIGKM